MKPNLDFDFESALCKYGLTLSPVSLETLWVNITRLCNQECRHCHVDASPRRTEHMGRRDIDRCLEILAFHEQCRNLDVTGGAPELNTHFDYFVTEARRLNKHVVVRHNLTVMADGDSLTGQRKDYLPEFFAGNGVEILASLPHFRRDITEEVRGRGVFDKSIEGIRRLNGLGYGKADNGLILNLVYNHDGPLSPKQKESLEADFRAELWSRYGLVFNRLYAVTNMPVNRYRNWLLQSGEYKGYMQRLADAFSSEAAKGVVCRSLISVGYDGRVYDCDFNQMLGMQINNGSPVTIYNLDFKALLHRKIQFGSHCFGCTAGGGSS